MVYSFFFNDTATTEIYTLSLHDALPIYAPAPPRRPDWRDSSTPAHERPGRALPRLPSSAYTPAPRHQADRARHAGPGDRKSTRLKSSHANISYAVFFLKKKKYTTYPITT